MSQKIQGTIQVPIIPTLPVYQGRVENFISRYPDFRAVTSGNMIAGATVSLVTAVAGRSLVILYIYASFDAVTYVQVWDNLAYLFGWRATGAYPLPINLFPFGVTLGQGNPLQVHNSGAVATNYDFTVLYTFDDA